MQQCSQSRQVTRHINASTQHRKQYYGSAASLELANSDKDDDSLVLRGDHGKAWNNKLTSSTMQQFAALSQILSGWKTARGTGADLLSLKSGTGRSHNIDSQASNKTDTSNEDIPPRAGTAGTGEATETAGVNSNSADIFYPEITIWKYPGKWLPIINQKEIDI